MKYVILLENRENGDQAIVEAGARGRLESLSPKIKVALRLPYTDYAWHRFVLRGITYVPDEHLICEPDMLWEYEINPGPYRSSEDISIERAFTSLGSAILYRQDDSSTTHTVWCTLLKRLP